jgi:hypothetical protein
MGQEHLGQVRDSRRPPLPEQDQSVTNSILFRYCEHLGVDPDPYLLASRPTDFETFIDWILRTTKEKMHGTISQIWKRLCQSYSILAQQPMDSFTTEQVRRVRPVHFIHPRL